MRWIAVALLSLLSLPAMADGVPVDGALGFQPAASPLMEEITSFHNILLWIIIPVTLF